MNYFVLLRTACGGTSALHICITRIIIKKNVFDSTWISIAFVFLFILIFLNYYIIGGIVIPDFAGTSGRLYIHLDWPSLVGSHSAAGKVSCVNETWQWEASS